MALALFAVVLLSMLVEASLGFGATVITLALGALLVPAVAAGLLIGNALHGRIPEARFRVAVYALLAASGLALLRS